MEETKEVAAKPVETPAAATPVVEEEVKKKGRPRKPPTEAQIRQREINLAKGREIKNKKYELQQKLLQAAERFLLEENKKEKSAAKPAKEDKAPSEPKVEPPKPDPVIVKEAPKEPVHTEPPPRRAEPVQTPQQSYQPAPTHYSYYPGGRPRKLFSLSDLLK